MKKLNYNGFGNAQSSCEYGIGQIGDQTALVFYAPKLHGTSITNMIETLTTHVLSSDLQGQDPRTVRVFEHYDPSINPLVEWQEVTFKDIGKVNPRTSVLQKMLALVVPSNKPPEWYVDGPSWKPVASNDITILSGIK